MIFFFKEKTILALAIDVVGKKILSSPQF